MFNVPKKQSKTRTYTGSNSVQYEVDTPQLFTMRKTAMFGMFSLLSILMLNVPILLENTYAYGADGYENLESGEDRSLVRTHFVVGSIVHPSLVLDEDRDEFTLLEERTNERNHFSYGYVKTYDSNVLNSISNFHDERRI